MILYSNQKNMKKQQFNEEEVDEAINKLKKNFNVGDRKVAIVVFNGKISKQLKSNLLSFS
jgi:SOS response regulatory protein OraA/RecX